MRLELKDIIHVPDAKKTFSFQMDLSDMDLYGRKPFVHPVYAQGCVTNHAGALVLDGTIRSELELVCDRCGNRFPGKKWSSWTRWWPTTWRMRKAMETSSCWTGHSWTWTKLCPQCCCSKWIPKTFAQTTVKGCVPSAEPI